LTAALSRADNRLTGYFATGRHGGRFGYYRCARCNGVSIRREALEVEFVNLLNSVALLPELLEALRRDVLAEWEATRIGADAARGAKERQVRAIREKKSRLLDAYLAKDVDPAAYRAKLAEIDEALAFASVDAVDALVGAAELEGALAYAEHALGRPGAFWTQASAEGKRGFAGVVFPAGLTYDPGKGFANPIISPIFKHLRHEPGGKVKLAALPDPSANPLGPLIALFRACRAA
jgi:hypothetical protein